MEHRIGSRVTANLDAEIYQNGEKLGVFLIDNIGASGLCVEDGDNHLRPNNFLQVVIKSPGRSYQTNALVVWTTEQRAGLLRADQSVDFSELLRQIPERSPEKTVKSRYGKRVTVLDEAAESFCEHCCTRKSCPLGRLEIEQPGLLNRVVRHPKPLRKGDRLFMQGDDFYSLYLVRSGSFKSCITDPSGDCQITGFHFPGDILGLDGIESGRHLYEVKALETASICTFPFHLVETIADRNRGSFCRQLMRAVSGVAYRESHLLMVLGRMHAEQRLASFLLEISRQMADRGKSALEFNLSMARYDIASYLGLAVETVSRLFRRFQEDGLVEADRHRVRILNMERLREIVASEHRFSGLRNIA